MHWTCFLLSQLGKLGNVSRGIENGRVGLSLLLPNLKHEKTKERVKTTKSPHSPSVSADFTQCVDACSVRTSRVIYGGGNVPSRTPCSRRPLCGPSRHSQPPYWTNRSCVRTSSDPISSDAPHKAAGSTTERFRTKLSEEGQAVAVQIAACNNNNKKSGHDFICGTEHPTQVCFHCEN